MSLLVGLYESMSWGTSSVLSSSCGTCTFEHLSAQQQTLTVQLESNDTAMPWHPGMLSKHCSTFAAPCSGLHCLKTRPGFVLMAGVNHSSGRALITRTAHYDSGQSTCAVMMSWSSAAGVTGVTPTALIRPASSLYSLSKAA